ncbi:hypothetical protein [Noviherbaspirillum aerium]|uniref:hypothetical protein n=1 Tax=Noviherbaspirillum aerium TaxID=2588497 RepID=UPI00124CE49B|nr:hypothetical protein [Noviherbaspirillum aerium]
MGKVSISDAPQHRSVSEHRNYREHEPSLEDRIQKLNRICRELKERQRSLQAGVSSQEILEILSEEQRRLKAALSED